MKCLIFILAIIFAICNAKKCKVTQEKKPPNIIIILGDDIGWNDFGLHSSNQIATPNIDALGYNGVVLNRFYTQHICTPSRTALLTGNYPIRSGMQGVPLSAGENRSLPLDMPTLPEKLKELGYATSLVGKWHLGAPLKQNTPTGRGFDNHFGYWNGYVGYFDFSVAQEMPENKTSLFGFDLHDNFVPQWSAKGRYATELFTEKSLEIIDDHDTEKPLFLMLCHLAAHAGANGTELGVPNIDETNAKYSYIKNPERRRYADIVNIMDASVGQIVKKLSDKNMLENSIILFFSDNGAQTVGIYQNYGSNWPFRGLKFTLLEGGVRGTGVVYSPLFKQNSYINNHLFHISDWLPTLYSAAGGDVKNLGKIDGVNQWQRLVDNTGTTRDEILLNIDEVLNFSALITDKGRYKLINGSYKDGIYDQFYGESGRGAENPPYNISQILKSETNEAIRQLGKQPPLKEQTIKLLRSKLDLGWCQDKINPATTPDCTGFCLFDLFADPCETRNILGEKPLVAQKLKKKLTGYFASLLPQTNKPVDPKSNPVYFNNTWYTWLEKSVSYDEL